MNKFLDKFSRSFLLDKLHHFELSEEEFFYLKNHAHELNSDAFKITCSEFEITVDCLNTNEKFHIYYHYDLINPIVEKIEY